MPPESNRKKFRIAIVCAIDLTLPPSLWDYWATFFSSSLSPVLRDSPSHLTNAAHNKLYPCWLFCVVHLPSLYTFAGCVTTLKSVDEGHERSHLELVAGKLGDIR